MKRCELNPILVFHANISVRRFFISIELFSVKAAVAGTIVTATIAAYKSRNISQHESMSSLISVLYFSAVHSLWFVHFAIVCVI